MTTSDQLYRKLYVKMKRLMTMNMVHNKEEIDALQHQLRELRLRGDVSDQTIQTAPYLPWR